MADTLTSPSAGAAKVRFQEQYVSEGLNKKLHGIVPRGVVRGGNLATSGAGLSVRVNADVDTGDSVYSYVDAQGHQVTFRQVGDVTLNLAGVTGIPTDVFIALYINYTVSNPTTVEWRAYAIADLTTAPVAEAADVIIVGRVSVPAVGPIPAADVTPEGRREAWDAVSRATIPWHQIVENGRFDLARPGAVTTSEIALGWRLSSLTTSLRTWSISTAAPYVGPHELQVDGGAGFGTTDVAPGRRMYAVGAGDKVRVAFRIRGSVWAGVSAAGIQGVQLTWLDDDMQFLSYSDITDNTLLGTFAYTEIDEIVEAPAGAAFMDYAVVLDPGANAPTGSLFFDDVRVWVQPDPHLRETKPQRKGHDTKHFGSIELVPTSVSSITDFMDRSLRLHHAGVGIGDPEYLWRRLGAGGSWVLDMVSGAIKELEVRLGSELGVDLNTTTPADHTTPRIITNHEDDAGIYRTLLWEMGVTGPTSAPDRVPVRIYHVRSDAMQSRNGLEITVNCSWDNTTMLWTPDDAVAAQAPAKFAFGGSVMGYFGVNSVVIPASWTDDNPQLGGGWDFNYFTVGGGGFGVPPAHPGGYENGAAKVSLWNGSLHFNDPSGTESNPPATSTSTVKNTLYAKTMNKAWATIRVGPAEGPAASLAIIDGYNLASVITGGLLGIDITWLRPVDLVVPVFLPPGPPAPPAVPSASIVAVTDAPLYSVAPTVFFKGVTGAHLVIYDTTTGGPVDVNALGASIQVSFYLKGQQT